MNHQLSPILSTKDYNYLKLVLSGKQDYSLDRETIQMLQRKLDEAHLMEPEDIPPDLVTMNSRVHIQDLSQNKFVIRTLVYPSYVGDGKRNLSVLSPWGLAILGAREGEVIEWPLPWSYVRLKIFKISHQPDVKLRRPRMIA